MNGGGKAGWMPLPPAGERVQPEQVRRLPVPALAPAPSLIGRDACPGQQWFFPAPRSTAEFAHELRQQYNEQLLDLDVQRTQKLDVIKHRGPVFLEIASAEPSLPMPRMPYAPINDISSPGVFTEADEKAGVYLSRNAGSCIKLQRQSSPGPHALCGSNNKCPGVFAVPSSLTYSGWLPGSAAEGFVHEKMRTQAGEETHVFTQSKADAEIADLLRSPQRAGSPQRSWGGTTRAPSSTPSPAAGTAAVIHGLPESSFERRVAELREHFVRQDKTVPFDSRVGQALLPVLTAAPGQNCDQDTYIGPARKQVCQDLPVWQNDRRGREDERAEKAACPEVATMRFQSPQLGESAKLETAMRRHLHREELEQQVHQEATAVKLQNAKRSRIARLEVTMRCSLHQDKKEELAYREVEAVKLQSAERCHDARVEAALRRRLEQEEQDQLRNQEAAAVKLQNAQRSRNARLEVKMRRSLRQEKKEELAYREVAAVKLQSAERCHDARVEAALRRRLEQEEPEQLRSQEAAAVKLQNAQRSRNARLEVEKRRKLRQAEDEELTLSEAAAAVKLHSAQGCYDARMEAATLRQLHQEELEKLMGQEAAAVNLQNAQRSRLARLEVERRFRWRQEEAEELAYREVSAVELQSGQRRHSAKLEATAQRQSLSEESDDLSRREMAAVKIQQAHRRRSASIEVEELRRERRQLFWELEARRNAAANVVQSAHRSRSVQWQQARQSKEEAAGHALQQRQQQEHEELAQRGAAAHRLQNAQRNHVAKSEVHKRRQEQRESEEMFACQHLAALKLQGAQRASNALVDVAERKERTREAREAVAELASARLVSRGVDGESSHLLLDSTSSFGDSSAPEVSSPHHAKLSTRCSEWANECAWLTTELGETLLCVQHWEKWEQQDLNHLLRQRDEERDRLVADRDRLLSELAQTRADFDSYRTQNSQNPYAKTVSQGRSDDESGRLAALAAALFQEHDRLASDCQSRHWILSQTAAIAAASLQQIHGQTCAESERYQCELAEASTSAVAARRQCRAVEMAAERDQLVAELAQTRVALDGHKCAEAARLEELQENDSRRFSAFSTSFAIERARLVSELGQARAELEWHQNNKGQSNEERDEAEEVGDALQEETDNGQTNVDEEDESF